MLIKFSTGTKCPHQERKVTHASFQRLTPQICQRYMSTLFVNAICHLQMKPPQYLATVIKSTAVTTGGAWVKLEKVARSEKFFVK